MLIYVEFLNLRLLRWAASGHGASWKGAKMFSASRLQSDAAVAAKQYGRGSQRGPAGSRGSPGWFFWPAVEKVIGVSLPGHATMSGLNGASGLSCSCLPSRQGLLHPGASGYVWEEVCRNLGRAQAENQVGWSSRTAPAAAPRKGALMWPFYHVLLFSAL